MAPPTLPSKNGKGPARQAGGKRAAPIRPQARNADLPILMAQEIVLEDGTKIPIKIPEGMPAAQAHALIEYLKANPEAAKQVLAQANQIRKTPGMADAFLNMQNNMATQGAAEKYAALKDDPELKEVFDDVVANGPTAFQKYWDDAELMQKISAKMRGMNPAAAPIARAPPSGPPADLHEAAKRGDLEALGAFLDKEGQEVDARNDRGVTSLGVAVGFNQDAVVTALIAKGADLEAQDPAGNTCMHYAAGYGRKQICQHLLAAGANVHALNKEGQKPIDAAKMNKEKQLIELLEVAMGEKPVSSEADQTAATLQKLEVSA